MNFPFFAIMYLNVTELQKGIFHLLIFSNFPCKSGYDELEICENAMS